MDDTTGLQFERAEFADGGSPTTCGFCKGDIPSSYYQVNGAVACETCRNQVQAAMAGQGTSAGRFLRAFGAGLGAAIGGALLYYAISALTGYEFGLIAIVVGVAVGKAVRWGSGGRGGWRYQTLAMALTYMAIVSTYIPPLIQAIRERPETAVSGQASASPVVPVSSTDASSTEPPPSLSGAIVAMALLAGLIVAMPFLAGLQNIMGLIIIGIGMYEAWKFTRRVPIVVTGPHLIARPAAASPTA